MGQQMSQLEDGDIAQDEYAGSLEPREDSPVYIKSEQQEADVEASSPRPFQNYQPSSQDLAFSSQLPYQSERIRDAHKATNSRLLSQNLERSSPDPASKKSPDEDGVMDVHASIPPKAKKRRSKKHALTSPGDEVEDAGSLGEVGSSHDHESQAPSAVTDDIRPFQAQPSMDLDSVPTSVPFAANGLIGASDAGEDLVDDIAAEEARKQKKRERKERKRAKKLAERLHADTRDENPSVGSPENSLAPTQASSHQVEAEEPDDAVMTTEADHKQRRRRSRHSKAEREPVPDAEHEANPEELDVDEQTEERNQLPTPDDEVPPSASPKVPVHLQSANLDTVEPLGVSAQTSPLKKRKAQDGDNETRKKRKQRLSQGNAMDADNRNGDREPVVAEHATTTSASPSRRASQEPGGSARRIGDLARDFYSQHYASRKSNAHDSADLSFSFKRTRHSENSPTAARLQRTLERSASPSAYHVNQESDEEEANGMEVDSTNEDAGVSQQSEDDDQDLAMPDIGDDGRQTRLGSDDLGVDPTEVGPGDQDGPEVGGSRAPPAREAPASAAKLPSTAKKSKQPREYGSRSSTSRKRVAKTSFLEQTEDANARAFDELPSPTAASSSRKKKGKGKERAPTASAGPSNATPTSTRLKQRKISAMMGGDESGPSTPSSLSGRQVRKVRDPKKGDEVTGQFSDLELQTLDDAITRWCEDHDIGDEQRNEMVQQNPQIAKTGDFWDHVQAALPQRKRQKIINQARKVYHSFVARGSWTKEQHDELALAFETHGKNYKLIGQIINRHPEDVRDRIRNYVICGDNRKTDVWTHEEETRLVGIINEALDNIVEFRVGEGGSHVRSKEDEAMIDWQLVSENMDRTRSRLQCLNKWRQIRSRMEGGNIDGKSGRSIGEVIKVARGEFENMTEKHRCLVARAVRKSGAKADSRIPWWKLRNEYATMGQWERPTLMLAWSRMRSAVPDNKVMSVKEIADKLITVYNETSTVPILTEEEIDLAAEYREMEHKIKKIIRSGGPPKTPHTAIKSDDEESDGDAEQGDSGASIHLGDEDEVEDADDREINESELGTPPPAEDQIQDSQTAGEAAQSSTKRKRRRATESAREVIEESPEASAPKQARTRSVKKTGAKSSNSKMPTSTTKIKKARSKGKAKAAPRPEPDPDEGEVSSDTDADNVEDIPAVFPA